MRSCLLEPSAVYPSPEAEASISRHDSSPTSAGWKFLGRMKRIRLLLLGWLGTVFLVLRPIFSANMMNNGRSAGTQAAIMAEFSSSLPFSIQLYIYSIA